jgi:hypothetical protein
MSEISIPSRQKLQSLIDCGQTSIRLILAPPRTGSTLVEALLSQNDGIQASCHEPFVMLGYYGEDSKDGYRRLIEAIEKNKSEMNVPITLLVKEMSHWLAVKREFEKLLPLVSDPVLFLIRNPLLSMESRIKKVLQVWKMKEKPALIDWLSSSPFSVEEGYIRTNLELQRSMLDKFAQSYGIRDWKSLLEKQFAEQDYRMFGELLKIGNLFPLENAGWRGLRDEIEYLEKEKRKYIVVDGTEFRLASEYFCRAIFREWGFNDSEQKIDWGSRLKGVDIRMDKPHYRLWYDSLLDGDGVKPPTEIAAPLSKFPEDISQYLRDVAIPIYIKAFLSESRVAGETSRINRNKERLREIDPYVSTLLDPELLRAERVGVDKEHIETWRFWKDLLLAKSAREGNFD